MVNKKLEKQLKKALMENDEKYFALIEHSFREPFWFKGTYNQGFKDGFIAGGMIGVDIGEQKVLK